MVSLLVTIFLVELALQLINSIGAATINNLLWTLCNSMPTAISRELIEQRRLQKEYLSCRKELAATSGQDEFAKWARLRRTHDKLFDQLEKKKTSLDTSRARFDRYVTTVRLTLTRGLQWFLPFWYSREPMFWLPYGWFPYYIEWFLSFPKAPLGSVSIVAWQWACTNVLVLAAETISALLGLALRSQREESAAMPGGVPGVPLKDEQTHGEAPKNK